jgi:hypothetical protein
MGPTPESPTAKPEPSFTTLSQKQQEPEGKSARIAAVSTQQPSALPAQVSRLPGQPPLQQAAISVTIEPPAAKAEGSATTLPQQPTLARKLPAQAAQNTARATEKLLEPKQGPSGTTPQAEPPKRQAELSAPEQPSTQAAVKSAATAPKEASLATEKATGNATKPQILVPAKLRATKAQLKTETVEAQVQDCKALRKAFRLGTLVRSVDKAAYRRLVACQRLKNDQKQGAVRIAGKAFNQGTNQRGSDGGTTGGGGTGGPGNSGGNGKGKGKGKGK